jgi:MSHA biogenesis protein MshG
MPLYAYKARDASGKVLTGRLEGKDPSTVADLLGQKGIFPITIATASGATADGKPPLSALIPRKFLQFNKKINPKELIYFSRQIATLYGAGIPLLNGLTILAEQTTNPYFQEVLNGVIEQIKEGKNLSASLAKYPNIFIEIYVYMVESGESSGTLEQVFERLANHMEYEMKIKSDIKAATRYPKIVVIALLSAFILAVSFIIPKFMGIFKSTKLELPLPSKILMNLSIWFRFYWYYLAVMAAGAWIGLKMVLKTPKGRLFWDEWKLKIPIFGPLFMKIFMSRFIKTFVSLNQSGIPILTTLDISANTFGNAFLAKVVRSIKEGVKEGADVWERMRNSKVFPPLVYHMFAIGESSGTLDRILGKISDYYDREVDYSVKNLTSLIEPILIVTMGAMVLFIALGVFLPMWDLTKLAKKG